METFYACNEKGVVVDYASPRKTRNISIQHLDPSLILSNSTWPTRDRLVPLAVHRGKKPLSFDDPRA